MNNNAIRKVFTEKYSYAIVLLVIVMLFPFSSFAHSPGYMGGHMMDEETREKMMEQRGYGPGYGHMGNMMGGGPGWMGNMMGGGYGHMMGGGYGHMMGGGFGGMMGNLIQLDLSKDQRDKIRDIHFSMHKENHGLMDEMMAHSNALAKLYDSEKLDPGKIGKAYDDVFMLKRKMIIRHVEARNMVYGILNKEQREKFKSFGSFGHMGGMMMY